MYVQQPSPFQDRQNPKDHSRISGSISNGHPPFYVPIYIWLYIDSSGKKRELVLCLKVDDTQGIHSLSRTLGEVSTTACPFLPKSDMSLMLELHFLVSNTWKILFACSHNEICHNKAHNLESSLSLSYWLLPTPSYPWSRKS